MSNIDNNKDINKILKETYTKESFGGSSGLLAVREDPSRHIQRTDKEGIYFMFTEILDNSIDESVEVANLLHELDPTRELDPIEIHVSLDQNTGVCTVMDHGRGITIEKHEKYDFMPTVVALFERDNTGSKGVKAGVTKKGYGSSTMGVHGAGAFVVTACSEFMVIQTRIYNEEKGCVDIYEIEYHRGIPVEGEDRVDGRLKYIGEDRTIRGNNRANTGLSVLFKPDLDIMSLYNPHTQKVEEDYYLINQIKKRIIDTLYTISTPLVIYLEIDGHTEVYDSRELSYSYHKELDKDYLFSKITPDPELKELMDRERISDFSLELMMMPLEDTTKKVDYVGFVNRIRVGSSPHIEQLRYLINAQIKVLCERDHDLKGFFRMEGVRGLRIIPLLYVEHAQWGGQVKTDYSDHRVAQKMADAIARSGQLRHGGYFHPMIQFCFEQSKPWMLAEKTKEENMRKALEAKKKKEVAETMNKKRREKLGEDLRYLNKEGTYTFSLDAKYSDVIIVEGRSAGGALDQIMELMPNIALFTGLFGKSDNANKVDRSYAVNMTLREIEASGRKVSPLDKLDVILSTPFRRFLSLVDNDADGAHMTALRRFYIWKFHRHVIEDGRLYEITPHYCDYTAPSGLKYMYRGEEKELGSNGVIRTSDEYEVVRKTFPGIVKFKLFKGVGSVAVTDLYHIIKDTKNWVQVPPLTPEEEYQLNSMFTNSSQFKKVFTEVNYMEECSIRKERVKSTIYKDTTISPEELYNPNLLSSYPVFTSVSRKSLEDYEELGSSDLEMEYLKRQLERIKEDWGRIY